MESEGLTADDLTVETQNVAREQTKLKDYVRSELTNALIPVAVLEAEVRAEIERRLAAIKQRVLAEIEEQKAKLQAKIEAIIPEEVKIKIAEAQRKIAEIKIEIDKAIEPVRRAALYAQRIAELLSLAEGLPAEIVLAIVAEVQVSLDEARAIAAENAKADETAKAAENESAGE